MVFGVSVREARYARNSAAPTTTAAEMDGILEAIGAVDTGVCNGIAAYSELGVDWVRTGFVLGSLVTGGRLVVVYIALALILPVAPTRDAVR